MPRMDHRLQLRDRFTPEGERVVQMMLTFLNEVRSELGLDSLTETHVLDHIRRTERLAQAEKEVS